MQPDVSIILSNPSATIVTLPNGKPGYSVPNTVSALQIQNRITALKVTRDAAVQALSSLETSITTQQATVDDCTGRIDMLTQKLKALQAAAPNP